MFSQLFVLAVLIMLNAFFAASEIALISLNDNKIRAMAEEGDKKAILLRNLLSEPSRFLATIQIGITLAGFLASAFASESFADSLVNLIRLANIPVPEAILKPTAVMVITVLLAYFTLVLGELVPKRVAMQKAEQISWLAIGPLTFLSRITGPFVRLLTLSTNFFVRLFGGNLEANEENVTEEEIRMMIDAGEERGTIQQTEKQMINNIFEFDDTQISEIMTHRTDIIGIPVHLPLGQVLEVMNNEKYSRIPVFEGTIDNIVGILHLKDLIRFVNKPEEYKFELNSIMRKPYYVPSSKKTDELLAEMQKSKTHMAVVIDEYGGTAGIITIEDLLEEIVGNIFDEYDEEEKEIEKIDENTFIFDGSVSLDKVEDLIGVNLPIEEYDTLSGFVIGQLGRIPDREEKPVIEMDNIIFKVEDIEEKRISKVKVCRA